MERTDILELMSRLKLYGMRAAYDEVMTTGIKRRHEPPRIVGDLLSAEVAEKQVRAIKYQLTIAKLPLAKGRFYTVVDLVNRLESEARASRQGRLTEYRTRMDFIILDELGYLPFAQTGGQRLCHL